MKWIDKKENILPSKKPIIRFAESVKKIREDYNRWIERSDGSKEDISEPALERLWREWVKGHPNPPQYEKDGFTIFDFAPQNQTLF